VRIFVSGTSSGLGLHIAEELLSQGDNVWGIGRREFDIEIIQKSGQENFKYSQCDTTVYSQVKNTFEQMIESGFIPDIAIFCAGSATEDIAGNEFSLDKLRRNVEVNLLGVLSWVELLIPRFLGRNRGTFAGVSSMSTFRENHRKRIGYSASKLALNKCFENLRLEYSDRGVNFVIFNMGRMTKTRELIGVSYEKASRLIVDMLKSDRRPTVVNIPRSQFLLTRAAELIPEKLFRRYIMG
jgi:NAD(P)-dependent dehydrogenase (short-subunit alcohol dehydrogenase family)